MGRVCDRRGVSVLGSGFARADIPPREPPSKGCAVGSTAGAALVLAVLVGLALARARRR
jgi:MYXO-CTERM domain-containing protein